MLIKSLPFLTHLQNGLFQGKSLNNSFLAVMNFTFSTLESSVVVA